MIKRVNLGNWLVLEKWMAHRDSYITERDFAYLANHGIDRVRIPVPFFIFGDHPPYIGCIEYLDKAFDWAEAHELTILLDLHTVPDSQNGFDDGGLCGVCKWHKNPAHVESRVDPGEGLGGLSVRIDEGHHYDVEVGDGVVRARGRVGTFCQTWEHPVGPGPVTLRIELRPTAGGEGLPVAPDVVHLSDGPVELAALDGRYLSAETAAAFTGRAVGMYAVHGAVAFDAVRYEGRDEASVPAPGDVAMVGGAR